MNLFFATDVHGSETCFRKFLNTPRVYPVKTLILGGDMTGKMVVPIIERNGSYYANIHGAPYEAHTPQELEKLKKTVRDASGYPFLTTPDDNAKIEGQQDRIEALFEKLAFDVLEQWLQLAEERLKGSGVKIYLTGGNDDPLQISKVIRKYESDTILMAEEKTLTLNSEHEMISLGYSNPTPWHLPRDITEDELLQKIEAMACQVHEMKKAIFNLHVPPYDTPPIDYAPQLDETLKPKLEGTGFKMVPVGSVAVRKSLEKFQPLIGLHGHIHESRGAAFVNNTVCINPGSEYGEGVLRGVILQLSGSKKPSYVFTSG